MAGPGAGTVQAAVAFLTPGEKNYYAKTMHVMSSGRVSYSNVCELS